MIENLLRFKFIEWKEEYEKNSLAKPTPSDISPSFTAELPKKEPRVLW